MASSDPFFKTRSAWLRGQQNGHHLANMRETGVLDNIGPSSGLPPMKSSMEQALRFHNEQKLSYQKTKEENAHLRSEVDLAKNTILDLTAQFKDITDKYSKTLAQEDDDSD